MAGTGRPLLLFRGHPELAAWSRRRSFPKLRRMARVGMGLERLLPDLGRANRLASDRSVQLQLFDTLPPPRSPLRLGRLLSELDPALTEVSRKSFPEVTQDDLDVMLRDAFEGAEVAEQEDAQEMSAWVHAKLGLDVPASALSGQTFDKAHRDRRQARAMVRACVGASSGCGVPRGRSRATRSRPPRCSSFAR